MCTSPKVIICYGKNEKGKYITSFQSWTPELERFLIESKTKHYKVGCGRCLDCRLEYAKRWANRLELQRKVSDNAYFVTLTYNDDHLKYLKNSPNASVVKKDFQDFIKRLRKYQATYYPKSKKLFYFLCAEYGDSTLRPHGHMIIFNLPFDDFSEYFPVVRGEKVLKKHLYSNKGEMLFYSQKLEELWSNGNVQTELACWENMRYVAGYITKKQYGRNSKIYELLKVNPPFLLMSQGIAAEYLRIHKKAIYQDDAIYILKEGEAKQYKPPRYFDNIMMLEKPKLIEKIKQDRENSILFNTQFNVNKSDTELVSEVKNGEYRKSMLNKRIKRDII